ncbi:DUF1684 domain-containing protein [Streptomyces sp. HNM0574]|uniref:DUF1684 domain-containing protein n=1 Tax=Streptomyces sp. HNM0574 TaxID=2714954 RepID=UPI001469BD9B|nr:DUF1684 domain-containing protein [Streptomyces sp. HNM0574]NLU69054.1 DUF1684 domain-containing protein [Streptomyces sp. HNM0574]
MSADTHAQQRDEPADGEGGEERGEAAWLRWHEGRLASVSAPYGPLSVTGTHWITEVGPPATGTGTGAGSGTGLAAAVGDGPSAVEHGRIEGVPGQWTLEADGGGVLLEAHVSDGLAVDGELLTGRVLLTEDGGPPASSRVSYGERRLVLMRREDQWAVRVFDPDSALRRVFAGIDVFPYDPARVVSGTYRPYAGGEHSVRVGNADGRERGLGLDGELGFAGPDGAEHTLRVSRVEGGGLWAVLADGTSGVSSYRFRFLYTEAPAAYGAVTVDFNRITLPPCAFTDHFLCPLPPPGNTLPFALPAGERGLAGH